MALIRPAKIKDLPEVIKMRIELGKYFEKIDNCLKMENNGEKFFNRFFKGFIYSKKKKLLVAEVGDKLIGFGCASLMKKDPIYYIKKYAHINQMYIDERFRRKGIAGEMLKVFYKWFKQNKIKYIELSVLCANAIGRNAWAKYGFEDFLIRKRKILK